MNDSNASIASLFCVGLSGTELNDEDRRILDRGVGGIVLFARNVDMPDQIAKLIADARKHAGDDLIACVDQEGGRVARLVDGFTTIPTMRELGSAISNDDSDSRELAFHVGQCLGRDLSQVGFDMNFAPVLDVDTNPANPVIGDRSIGREAELVGQVGLEIIRGLADQGILACGKHFPGHGDTAQDSHLELPRLPHAMERLQDVELAPFQHVIQSLDETLIPAVAIMSAHVVFDAINDSLPGTLCPQVMSGLLREKMGFQGLCISDCLEMKAIADGQSWNGTVGAAVQSLEAGVDMPLICHTHATMHAAIDAAQAALDDGQLDASRIKEAASRLENARAFRRTARANNDMAGFEPTARFDEFVASAAVAGEDPTREGY